MAERTIRELEETARRGRNALKAACKNGECEQTGAAGEKNSALEALQRAGETSGKV